MKSVIMILALVTVAGCGSMGMKSGSTSSGSSMNTSSGTGMYESDASFSAERKISEAVALSQVLP